MQPNGHTSTSSGGALAAAAAAHHALGPRTSGASSEVARSSLDLLEGLPPGDAAEPLPEPAGAGRVWSEYNAPAAKRRRLRHSPYFRRGVQCAAGTAVILAAISAPAVYNALSLNPAMGPVFIMVFYFLVLLVALSSGVAPVQVAAEQLAGSTLGTGLGLSVIYIIYAINGCSYHDTALKGVLMALLSAVTIFCLTAMRFTHTAHATFHSSAGLTFAISTAVTYHTLTNMWKFPMFLLAYAALGDVVGYLCATFVLPITAGDMVRRRLAAGLQHTCEVLQRCLEISTGEVAPDTGLLVAVTGETAERIGIDSGLYAALQPLYAAATAGGRTIQEAYRHLGFAGRHVDVYRRQHRLPHQPWYLLLTMTRGMLNAAMMCVYPMQSGKQRATLIARHRAPLLALAVALTDCCNALGDVFVQNKEISVALEKLGGVERAFAALAAATRFKGSKLSQDVLALDHLLSLLFTACTRVRRMFVLLPEALGRDQPGCMALVLQHFEGPGAIEWNFEALTQAPPQMADSEGAVELVRSALLEARPRRSLSSAALDLLTQPELKQVPPAAQQANAPHRVVQWIKARTGAGPSQLALATQMLVAYSLVLVLVIVPATNDAFRNSLHWSLFVVVSVIEPSTGEGTC
jgi:hypothetical protein